MATFLQELKRRNVFRVGVAYLALAWLVIQVTDMAVPALNLPETLNSIVFYIGLVGLPFALFFAWAFELTPEGIKRESDIAAGDSMAPLTRRRISQFTIIALSLALVFVVMDQYVLEERVVPAVNPAADAESLPAVAHPPKERSIAVLPFRNRSAVAEDAYFVDGIHDDILTLLTRVSAFNKVISRTSVERYRETSRSIPEIAEELDVTTILEGGVQRAGDRVRINVQLIDTATDQHLWAQTYDRELTVENIFAIQSEVAKSVVSALQASLSPAEVVQLEPAPPASLAAMEQYFLAKQKARRGATGDWQAANEHFEKAVELDPDFALGWANLGVRKMQMSFQNAEDRAIKLAEAFQAIERALELNPDLGEAYLALGNIHVMRDEYPAADEAFQRAQTLIPNSPDLFYALGGLRFMQGRLEESVKYHRMARDSGGDFYIGSSGSALLFLGRFEEARALFQQVIRDMPESPNGYSGIAASYWLQGQLARAVPWTRRAHEKNENRILNEQLHMAYTMLFWDLMDDEEGFCWALRHYEFDPKGFAENELMMLAWLIRGEREEALKFATRSREYMVSNAMVVGPRPYTLALLRDEALATGNITQIRDLYQAMFPQIFEPETLQINLALLAAALDVVPVLRKTGEEHLANTLLAASGAFIEENPVAGGAFAPELFVLLGQYGQAVEALEQFAVQGGIYWRVGIELNSNLAPLRELPEYIEVLQSLRDRAASQRAELAAAGTVKNSCRGTYTGTL